MFIRSLIGAGVIAGATLIGTAATAAADPPNCTAADLANVMSGVNAGMASYPSYCADPWYGDDGWDLDVVLPPIRPGRPGGPGGPGRPGGGGGIGSR